MFYGRGAGELPTASAVVGDVFDVVRNILHNCCGKIGCTCYKHLPIKKMEDIQSKYFVRMPRWKTAMEFWQISPVFLEITV